MRWAWGTHRTAAKALHVPADERYPTTPLAHGVKKKQRLIQPEADRPPRRLVVPPGQMDVDGRRIPARGDVVDHDAPPLPAG